LENNFELIAFVYMPEHVHMLVFPLDEKPDIGSYLAAIKQPLSLFVHQQLEEAKSSLLDKLMVRERPGKVCFRFWQEGPGYDRNLYSTEAIEASIAYIHQNPVRRDLCHQAVTWPWSTARYYYAEPTKQQYSQLPYVHGLRPQMLDRDEYR
jgi:putative transposase